jgi:hypothetical protein
MVERFEDLVTTPAFVEPIEVIGVGAISEEERQRRDRQDLPCPPGDELGERDGEAGADEVDGAVAGESRRPFPVDAPPRDQRRDHLRRRRRDSGIREHGSGNRDSVRGPDELPRRRAKRLECQPCRLRRAQDRCGVEGGEQGCLRIFRGGKPLRHKGRCADEEGGVRAEQQQRCEEDDELHRSRRPIRAASRRARNGSRQDGRQYERAELRRAAGRQPAGKSDQDPRPNCDRAGSGNVGEASIHCD